MKTSSVNVVHVGASQDLNNMVAQRGVKVLEKLSVDVGRELQDFIKASETGSPNILELCTRVAKHFGENVVASHFLNGNCALILFLDIVDAEVHSKFQYIPHSDWVH